MAALQFELQHTDTAIKGTGREKSLLIMVNI